MDTLTLAAERRTALGKKTKALRREGLTPANLDGRGEESIALQVPTNALRHLVQAAGHTSVVNLEIDGKKPPVPVLVREVQKHPFNDLVLHVNFYQVRLKESMQAEIPLVLVGQSEATKRGGVLLQAMTSMQVEALPMELPSEIEVDVTGLEHVDDALHVRDLVLPRGVTAVTDGDNLVVKVQGARKAEAEDEPAATEEPAPAAGSEQASE